MTGRLVHWILSTCQYITKQRNEKKAMWHDKKADALIESAIDLNNKRRFLYLEKYISHRTEARRLRGGPHILRQTSHQDAIQYTHLSMSEM